MFDQLSANEQQLGHTVSARIVVVFGHGRR
jgi:hypothetical protein